MNALKSDRLQHLAERLLRLQVMTGMGEGMFRQSLAVYARRYRKASKELLPDNAVARTPRSRLQSGSAGTIAAPAEHAAFLGQSSIARLVRRAPDQRAAKHAVIRARYGGTRRNASLIVAPGTWLASRIAAGSGHAPGQAALRPLSLRIDSVCYDVAAPGSFAIGNIPAPRYWTGSGISAGGPGLCATHKSVPIRTASFAPRVAAEPVADDRRISGKAGGFGNEPGNDGRAFSYEMPPPSEADRSGNDLGRWMMDYLERQLSRPRLGMTGVDPRVSPL